MNHYQNLRIRTPKGPNDELQQQEYELGPSIRSCCSSTHPNVFSYPSSYYNEYPQKSKEHHHVHRTTLVNHVEPVSSWHSDTDQFVPEFRPLTKRLQAVPLTKEQQPSFVVEYQSPQEPVDDDDSPNTTSSFLEYTLSCLAPCLRPLARSRSGNLSASKMSALDLSKQDESHRVPKDLSGVNK